MGISLDSLILTILLFWFHKNKSLMKLNAHMYIIMECDMRKNASILMFAKLKC